MRYNVTDANLGYCAGVKVTPQPNPAYNDGGDCYACGMTSLLQHLFPERDVKLHEIYELFLHPYYMAEDPSHVYIGSSWYGYKETLEKAQKEGWPITFFPYIVEKDQEIDNINGRAWGGCVPTSKWVVHMEAFFRAGWIACCSINYDGEGRYKINDKGNLVHNHQDHFVVIDGARGRWIDLKSGGRMYEWEAHIVCSAKGGSEYWIPVEDLHLKHGLGAMYLVKRNSEEIKGE